MAQHLARAAGCVDLRDLARFDHARGDKLRAGIRRADAGELQARAARHVEDLPHPRLRQQDRAVLGRIGEEGDGQHIGLRAGLGGEAVHHVMGVGRVMPRQPAEERDEADAVRVDAGHFLDRGGKGAAMTKADDGGIATLDLPPQERRPGKAQGAKRQVFFTKVRGDLAEVQPVAGAKLVLQLSAFHDLAVDGNFDHPVGHGAGDQAVRLDGRQAQPLGDSRLGQPARVMEPGRADGEAVFGVGLAGHDVLSQASAMMALRVSVGSKAGFAFIEDEVAAASAASACASAAMPRSARRFSPACRDQSASSPQAVSSVASG